MADKDRILGLHLPHRAWWSAVGFSALIIFMVAVGSTDQFGILTGIILAAVFSAAGTFLWMFPGKRPRPRGFAVNVSRGGCLSGCCPWDLSPV